MLRTSILPWNDPALRRPATAAEEVTQDIVDTARHMARVLEGLGPDNALGVAANQVGSPLAMFSFFEAPDTVLTVINPRITESSGEWMYREGCLSLPGHFWWISRPRYVHLTGLTLDGDEYSIDACDLLARLFQHEMDHMAGRLILDRLPKGTRKQALRKLAA